MVLFEEESGLDTSVPSSGTSDIHELENLDKGGMLIDNQHKKNPRQETIGFIGEAHPREIGSMFGDANHRVQ